MKEPKAPGYPPGIRARATRRSPVRAFFGKNWRSWGWERLQKVSAEYLERSPQAGPQLPLP
jgi:hypothetical protein